MLQRLLESQRDLTVPLIECISNLRISNTVSKQVRKTVLGILQSAPFADLPVAIRYLVESQEYGNNGDIRESRREVLEDLRIRCGRISDEDIVGCSDETRKTMSSSVPAIINTLHASMSHRPDIGRAYLEGIAASPRLSVIDFWFLIAMQKSNQHLKQVESVLESCVLKTYSLDRSVVRSAISNQFQIIEFLFPQFLKLAGFLVGAEAAPSFGAPKNLRPLQNLGTYMYHELYFEFRDTYFRQEIIYALVMHANSEASSEAMAGLECLEALFKGEELVHDAEPYVELVKSLSHNLHLRTDLNYTRKVFTVLSNIVICRSDPDRSGVGWFFILLRKLITNPYEMQRISGVIGSVQYLIVSSSFDGTDDSWREVVTIALASSRSSPPAMAALCSELSENMGSLNKPVVEAISEVIGEEFTVRFLASYNPVQTLESQFPIFNNKFKVAARYSLKDAAPKPQIVNLFQNLAKGHLDPRFRERFVYLAQMFSCIISSEVHSGNTLTPKLLFEMGLLLPDPTEFNSVFETDWQGGDEDLLENSRSAMFLSLFYGVEWIRELLNTMCQDHFLLHDEDPERMKTVVFARFEHLRELESLLEKATLYAAKNIHLDLLCLLPSSNNNVKVVLGMKKASKKSSSSSSSLNTHASRNKSSKDAVESLRQYFRPLKSHTVKLLTLKSTRNHPFVVLNVLQAALTTIDSVLGTGSSKLTQQAVIDLMALMNEIAPEIFVLLKKYSASDSEDSLKVVGAACQMILKLVGSNILVYEFREDHLVEKFLCSFCSRDDDTNSNLEDEDAIEVILVTSFCFFQKLAKEMTDLTCRCYLVDILSGLASFQTKVIKIFVEELYPRVASEAGRILASLSSSQDLSKPLIKRLLVLNLKHDASPIKAALTLVQDIEKMVQDDNETCEVFPVVTRHSLHFFYEPIMTITINQLEKNVDFKSHIQKSRIKRVAGKKRKKDSSSDTTQGSTKKVFETQSDEETLTQNKKWKDKPVSDKVEYEKQESDEEESVEGTMKSPVETLNACEDLLRIADIMIHITRHLDDKKQIVLAAVKLGQSFVDKFMKLASAFLLLQLNEHEQTVATMLQKLNLMTRQMCYICEYGKNKKDSALMMHIPNVRKTSEALGLKLRQFCDKSSGTFFRFAVGTLKSRNVDGSIANE